MEATFTISERDYERAMMLFYRPTPKATAIYAIHAAVFVLLAIFAPPNLDRIAALALIGGVAGGLLFHFVVYPFFAKRHYRKYKLIQEPFTIQLKDDGVLIQSDDNRGLIKWEHMHKWRQNDRYVLIYPMPKLFYIVPKTVGETGFDIAVLVEALRTNVGKPS